MVFQSIFLSQVNPAEITFLPPGCAPKNWENFVLFVDADKNDLSLSWETTARDEPWEGPAVLFFWSKHLCTLSPHLPGESATVQVIHLVSAFSEGPSFCVQYGRMSLQLACEKELKFLSTQDLNQIREEIHPTP